MWRCYLCTFVILHTKLKHLNVGARNIYFGLEMEFINDSILMYITSSIVAASKSEMCVLVLFHLRKV